MKVKCTHCGNKFRVQPNYNDYKRGTIREIKKVLENLGFDDRKKIMTIKVIVSGELLIMEAYEKI